MNEIQIKEHKIDWLKIINLAFKRRDWGKIYTLYNYKDVTVSCEMVRFDFSRSMATFKIFCSYVYNEENFDGDDYSDYEFVDYFLNNFTIKDFKSIVNRKIITLFKNIIHFRTEREAKDKYRDLHHSSWDLNLEKEVENLELSDDYDKLNSIDNETIRDRLIDEFSDSVLELLNEKYNEKVEEYMNNNQVDIPNFVSLKEKIKAVLEE